jgi:alpha-aminoadipate/glutamate carrier protein LysW
VSYDRAEGAAERGDVETGSAMSMPLCPACDAEVELDEFDVDKGEIVSCPECGVDLEVVGLSPIELDVAAPGEEEDDWGET